MDPFLDLIQLLRPRATLWGGTDGTGRWGLAFHKRDDLLFCWVERGECQLVRPQEAPVQLQTDDFVLIRTSTPFTLTSDPTVEPQDSETMTGVTKGARRKLGEGTELPVTLHAGKFVFDTANEDLLTDLLPSLVHVAAGDASSWRVRTLLEMNERESLQPGPGNEFIITRLMELILVEILRSHGLTADQEEAGMLAGLANPITAQALSAMHREVARDWTVSSLAKHCGVSRSKFAALFPKVVGKGPIEYLLRWRMALAKDALRRDTQSISEIAFNVGFQSASAFSTAFSRVVGCSPKRYALSVRR